MRQGGEATQIQGHTQTIREFPLTTHVGVDANQEVEDYELERTTVIQLTRRVKAASQMG